MTVSVEIISDDAAVMEMLFSMESALSDVGLVKYMEGIMLPYLKQRAKERFASEGDDATGRWAPLKPATQMVRQSHPEWGVGPEHPINIRTHGLEEYITGSDAMMIPTPGSVTIRYPKRAPSGSLGKKFKTAQQGSSNPKTVARPVLAVSAVDMAFFERSLLEYMILYSKHASITSTVVI